MPIHDWTRVRPGIFHAFHQAWIYVLQDMLNGGLLPEGYSALGEQVSGTGNPDLVTLAEESAGGNGNGSGHATRPSGAVAVDQTPPHVRFMQDLEASLYTPKASVLAIRHASSDDRIVAFIEIVSPGNKSSRHAIRAFADKAAGTLHQGIHLLIIDLHPPTPRDPQGIHAVIWSELGGEIPPPMDKPLTLAAYTGMPRLRAYIEPVAVGDVLTAMPLFLTTAEYVSVPLEESYTRAFRSMPARTRAMLEAP